MREICKWNTNVHWDVSTEKTELPFQEFRLFRKISRGTNQKVLFHLHLNRNLRNFLVTGKRSVSFAMMLRDRTLTQVSRALRSAAYI